MPRRTSQGRGPRLAKNPQLSGLANVDALIGKGRFADARRALLALERNAPDAPALISRRLMVARGLRDMGDYAAQLDRLSKLRPDDPEVAFGLAISAQMQGHLATARRRLAGFVERWPAHEHAEEARAQSAELDELLAANWRELGFAGEPDLELMAGSEQVQQLVIRGAWPEAVRLAEQTLARSPQLVPLRNNLSLIYQNLGQLDRAIAEAETVLAVQPANLHALGNLTRFQVLAGRLADGAATAERLKAIPVDRVEVALKQAEALSFLGDDAGVLAAFQQAERLDQRDIPPAERALLLHLVAAASLRQGDSVGARKRWQRAVELQPGFHLAADNLADLRRPIDERNAPWAYSIEYWISRAVLEELIAAMRQGPRDDEEAATAIARDFLARRPELTALAPLLLERGDGATREFMLRLASMARTPELLAALRDFATGPHGPSRLRIEAAQYSIRAGLLPGGAVPFWVDGRQSETIMLGFEISYEPIEHDTPPEVMKLQGEGAMAMRAGQFKRAETLFKQALALRPDDPTLVNNLAGAYNQMGRADEAEALMRAVFDQHPDYLFARTNIAMFLIRDGKADEAQALLDPLLSRAKLHASEFAAIAAAQVQVLLAQDKLKGAESWLEMLVRALPDSPNLPVLRAMVRDAKRRR